MLNGTGVSNEAQRITGASRIEKQFSAILAAISPPMPPINVSSCRINTLPVLATEVRMENNSYGNGKSLSFTVIRYGCQNAGYPG